MFNGARLLALVDDFALLEVPYDKTLKLKVYAFTLVMGLGLKIGEHLGMIIDMKVG